MREGTVELADGRALAYCEWGDPAGAPVIAHHGTPGCRLNRHPDLRLYETAGLRWISYDRPGYGRSSPLPDRRVADVAGDVAALGDALGLDRFATHGVSGGGPHALACAALLGERVTRAAIVVGAAPHDDPELDALDGLAPINVEGYHAAMAGREADAAYLEPYVRQALDDPLALWDEIAEQLPEPDRAVLRRPELRALLPEWTQEELRQGNEGWIEDDLALVAPWGFALESIRVPVRLWQGELDVLVPRRHGEYLAARIPGAAFELVPGEGHLLHDHHATVLAWLAGAAGAS